MTANDRQVGGKHYQKTQIQHWDFVASQNLDYFQGQITKYVCRWKDKNGLQDLEKARHFLEKYIEIETAKNPTISSVTVGDGKSQLSFELRGPSGMKHPFGFDATQEVK